MPIVLNGAPACLQDCPDYDDAILLPLGFWLEGVVQCTIALLGLIGNLISAIILSR